MEVALPLVERVLGSAHEVTLRLYLSLGQAIYRNPVSSRGDIVEAVAILKDNAQAAKRILGPAHPAIESFKVHITLARMIRYTIDLHNRYGEEPNFSSQA